MRMSRTAQGTLDILSTPQKAASMVGNLTPDIAQRVHGNLTRALRLVHVAARGEQFEDVSALRLFILDVARTVNRGITKSDAAFRKGDADQYAYVPAEHLSWRFPEFCEELFLRLAEQGDPRVLAAWVEYRVDLTDHFFADGCGRCAKVLSALPLLRHHVLLPDYTEGGTVSEDDVRARYYSFNDHALHRKRHGEDAVFDRAAWARWLAYYLCLFPTWQPVSVVL